MIPLIIAASILNFGLGIYVVIKNPSAKLNRLFGVLSFIIALWVLSNVMLFSNMRTNYPYIQLTYALGAFIPPIVFHWVVLFTKNYIKRTFIFLGYVASITVVLFSLVPGLLVKRLIEINSYSMETVFGILFIPYSFVVSALLLTSTVLLIKEWSKGVGLRKLQMSYVCIGFGTPIILIITVDFILPLLNDMRYYNFDSLASFFFVGILAYSITRYRFLDIKFVIRKGFVYGLSLVVALAFYTYLAIFGENLLQTSLNLSEDWGIFILVIVIALGFPPLKKGIEYLINQIFQKKRMWARKSGIYNKHCQQLLI